MTRMPDHPDYPSGVRHAIKRTLFGLSLTTGVTFGVSGGPTANHSKLSGAGKRTKFAVRYGRRNRARQEKVHLHVTGSLKLRRSLPTNQPTQQGRATHATVSESQDQVSRVHVQGNQSRSPTRLVERDHNRVFRSRAGIWALVAAKILFGVPARRPRFVAAMFGPGHRA